MSVYFRLHLPRYSESTRSLKSHGLVHLQLYPHHTPDAEGSHCLSVLSPPCHQLIRSLRVCSHHATRDRPRGCSLSKSPLFHSCFCASTNHHPLLHTFPRLKALLVISVLPLFIYQQVHHTTRSVLSSTADRLFVICRDVSLKSFHEVSTAPSRSCRENSSKFTNRLGHRTWQQTTCTQEKKRV